MKIEQLSEQDQIYYYHGLILHLSDELGKYDIYEYWLRRHRPLKKLKQQCESLQDQIKSATQKDDA